MNLFFNKLKTHCTSYAIREFFLTNYNFEFFNSTNKDIANKSYNLRYKVYCEELGFEKTDNQLEKDHHDNYSKGFIISSKNEKHSAIASVRVIPQNKNYELPCLVLAKEQIPNEYELIKNKLNNLTYIEISRLVILNNFRHKAIFGKDIQNYLLLVLFASTVMMSKENDLILFLCEKKLMLFLKRLGFNVQLLSEQPIEHKGLRYLVKINVKELNELIKKPTDKIIPICSIISLLKNKNRPKRLKLFLALESLIIFTLITIELIHQH